MVKVRKTILPHHVQERLRHQKLQLQLRHIAEKVPTPFSIKRETKDTKLRRVVLYMKFLRRKFELLKKQQKNQKESNTTATNGKTEQLTHRALKWFSYPPRSQAQIIFLKNPTTSEKNEIEVFCKGKKAKSLKKSENVPETSTHYESDASSNTDINNSVDEKHLDLKTNCDENNVYYVPNGGIAQFMTQKETSKESNNEVNLHIPLSSINSIDKNIAAKPAISEKHFRGPCMSIENTYNFIDSAQLSNSEANCYRERRDICRYYFGDNLQSCCNEKHALPPISTLLPQNCKKYEEGAYLQPSSSKSRDLMNSENCLFYDIQDQYMPLSLKVSSSDHVFSSDLVSSGESIETYFSNEWVSDDTQTDSGSLKDFVESPVEQCFEEDAHLIDEGIMCVSNSKTHLMNGGIICEGESDNCEAALDLSHPTSEGIICRSDSETHFMKEGIICEVDSENCEAALDLSLNRSDFGTALKFTENGLFHSNSSSNILDRHGNNYMPYPRNTAPLPFVVQKKRNTVRDDFCVPQSDCEISPASMEINEYDNKVISCDIFPRKEIKKESDDYLLPAEETSFSFKNFSQWCSNTY